MALAFRNSRTAMGPDNRVPTGVLSVFEFTRMHALSRIQVWIRCFEPLPCKFGQPCTHKHLFLDFFMRSRLFYSNRDKISRSGCLGFSFAKNSNTLNLTGSWVVRYSESRLKLNHGYLRVVCLAKLRLVVVVWFGFMQCWPTLQCNA